MKYFSNICNSFKSSGDKFCIRIWIAESGKIKVIGPYRNDPISKMVVNSPCIRGERFSFGIGQLRYSKPVVISGGTINTRMCHYIDFVIVDNPTETSEEFKFFHDTERSRACRREEGEILQSIDVVASAKTGSNSL